MATRRVSLEVAFFHFSTLVASNAVFRLARELLPPGLPRSGATTGSYPKRPRTYSLVSSMKGLRFRACLGGAYDSPSFLPLKKRNFKMRERGICIEKRYVFPASLTHRVSKTD